MRVHFLALTVALAVVCSLITWKLAAAQAPAYTPVPVRVFTGSDIGFRVESLRGDTPVGRLVVKVNGRWVETDFAPSVRPLSTQ